VEVKEKRRKTLMKKALQVLALVMMVVLSVWAGVISGDDSVVSPIIFVPQTGTTDVLLPMQEHPFSKAWTESSLDGGQATCRSFDLDRDGTQDVIFCWRDGRPFLRQWLNETYSYERFSYGEDGMVSSKEFFLSASETEGIKYTFQPLDPIPTLPALTDQYEQVEGSDNVWRKKNSEGGVEAEIVLTEDGSVKTSWWNEGPDRTFFYRGVHAGHDHGFVRKIRFQRQNLPSRKQTVFSQFFDLNGRPSTYLNTHLCPAPAYCAASPYLSDFEFRDRKDMKEWYLHAVKPGTPPESVTLADSNGDSNPEYIRIEGGVSLGPGTTIFFELIDKNSNGCFEKVDYREQDRIVSAQCPKDDGYYGKFRFRHKDTDNWVEVDIDAILEKTEEAVLH